MKKSGEVQKGESQRVGQDVNSVKNEQNDERNDQKEVSVVSSDSAPLRESLSKTVEIRNDEGGNEESEEEEEGTETDLSKQSNVQSETQPNILPPKGANERKNNATQQQDSKGKKQSNKNQTQEYLKGKPTLTYLTFSTCHNSLFFKKKNLRKEQKENLHTHHRRGSSNKR